MQKEMQKLSIREKIGYGLGDTASNLFFQTTIYFLMYFYTDVFGIYCKNSRYHVPGDPLLGCD